MRLSLSTFIPLLSPALLSSSVAIPLSFFFFSASRLRGKDRVAARGSEGEMATETEKAPPKEIEVDEETAKDIDDLLESSADEEEEEEEEAR